MDVPVVMPQLGLTMTEGAVAEWLKKPGDAVRKGDLLFVVFTDKADMEVESLAEGTLARIAVEPGRTVPVGTVIAYLEKPADDRDAGTVYGGAAKVTEPGPVQVSEQLNRHPVGAAVLESASATAERAKGPAASPRARRVARE